MRNRTLRIALLCISVCSFNSSWAQIKLWPVDTIVKKLNNRGADTILIYLEGATDHDYRNGCNCLGDVIYAAHLIYKMSGKTYKLNFSCCNETDTVRLTGSLGVSYFLSHKQTLIEPKDYFARKSKTHQIFYPPMVVTDYPFEEIQLIIPKQHFQFKLSSYQTGEGYKAWKQYPWIDKQIKLIELIKKDLMLTSK